MKTRYIQSVVSTAQLPDVALPWALSCRVGRHMVRRNPVQDGRTRVTAPVVDPRHGHASVTWSI
ncbi:MAG: hypothetical protein ACPGFC_08885, partial [Paracoccaceae bacterium]